MVKKRLTKNRGFLLVEAIIAITVIILVIATSISLLVMGQKAIRFNEHSLEANLLVQEAANSLRGLRDSNWLRFGYDKETCWTEISTGPAANCSGISLDPGDYRVEIPLGGLPVFEEGAIDFDEAMPNNFYKLHYGDTVTHEPAGNQESLFYRYVYIENANIDRLDAVATVFWFESGSPKSINVPVTLTNYAKEI